MSGQHARLRFVKIYKILKDKESPSSPQFKEMQTSFLLKKENKTETKQIKQTNNSTTDCLQALLAK